MQKFKRIIALFLIVITLFIISFPLNKVSAYSTPSADRYDFAITDIKILSAPPYREENNFKIGITVTYNATNYGTLEEQPDKWVECSVCHGTGMVGGGVKSCPTCGGSGGIFEPVPIPCKAPGRPRCQETCNGWDYKCSVCKHIQTSDYGNQDYCPHVYTAHQIKWRKCTCKTGLTEDKWIGCPSCHGAGQINAGAGEEKECPACHGECGKYVPVPPIWVPPTRPSEGRTQLSFTIAGLNQDYAIKDITVPIDGESVDNSRNGSGWSVWGSAYYEIELNACENIGKKDVEARINWDYKHRETNSNNNNKSTNIDVIPATNLQVEFISPNAAYRTDTDVITTYRILNKDNIGALNIRPKHNLTAEFKAIDKSTNKVMASCKNSDIVIPKHGSNIVYFKWHVPKDYEESDIKLQCDINTTKVIGSLGVPGVNEMDYNDNTAVGENEVQKYKVMETPDTVFENRPSWFIPPIGNETVPFKRLAQNIMDNSSWEVWEWDKNTDWYIKNTYGIDLKASQEIKPDDNCRTKEYIENKALWQIRSGYGFSLKSIVNVGNNGYMKPKDDSITELQHVNAYFPEYKYRGDTKKFRTLEKTNYNTFEFYPNENTITSKGKKDYRRVHFSPLWYPDGEYKVKTYAYDLWTPVGMISIDNDVTPILINGDMYDDWYVNHSEKIE